LKEKTNSVCGGDEGDPGSVKKWKRKGTSKNEGTKPGSKASQLELYRKHDYQGKLRKRDFFLSSGRREEKTVAEISAPPHKKKLREGMCQEISPGKEKVGFADRKTGEKSDQAKKDLTSSCFRNRSYDKEQSKS